VEVMQRELKDLQPILARTSQEVEDMMVVITNDKKEAGACADVAPYVGRQQLPLLSKTC